MADITDSATRSRMMSAIKGKDTQPELVVRKALHKLGLRYKLHVRGLPGTPDLVFPRYNVAVFVHGCFWHQHGCSNSTMPKTRTDFWAEKLYGNRVRDEARVSELLAKGWRVSVVWECSIRRELKLEQTEFFREFAQWIASSNVKFAEF